MRPCRRPIRCQGRWNIANVRPICTMNFRNPHSFCCYLFYRSTPSTTANLLHSSFLFLGESPQLCTIQAKRPHHYYGLLFLWRHVVISDTPERRSHSFNLQGQSVAHHFLHTLLTHCLQLDCELFAVQGSDAPCSLCIGALTTVEGVWGSSL